MVYAVIDTNIIVSSFITKGNRRGRKDLKKTEMSSFYYESVN